MPFLLCYMNIFSPHTRPKPTHHMRKGRSAREVLRCLVFCLISSFSGYLSVVYVPIPEVVLIFLCSLMLFVFILLYTAAAVSSLAGCFLPCYSYPVRCHFVFFPLSIFDFFFSPFFGFAVSQSGTT